MDADTPDESLLPIQSPAEFLQQPLEVAESHILKVPLEDPLPQPLGVHSLERSQQV